MYRVSSTSPAATGPARGFSASPSASQLAGRPGKIPLVGRLLSPERGGGMFFAAKYVIRGPCADADVRSQPAGRCHSRFPTRPVRRLRPIREPRSTTRTANAGAALGRELEMPRSGKCQTHLGDGTPTLILAEKSGSSLFAFPLMCDLSRRVANGILVSNAPSSYTKSGMWPFNTMR